MSRSRESAFFREKRRELLDRRRKSGRQPVRDPETEEECSRCLENLGDLVSRIGREFLASFPEFSRVTTDSPHTFTYEDDSGNRIAFHLLVDRRPGSDTALIVCDRTHGTEMKSGKPLRMKRRELDAHRIRRHVESEFETFIGGLD